MLTRAVRISIGVSVGSGSETTRWKARPKPFVHETRIKRRSQRPAACSGSDLTELAARRRQSSFPGGCSMGVLHPSGFLAKDPFTVFSSRVRPRRGDQKRRGLWARAGSEPATLSRGAAHPSAARWRNPAPPVRTPPTKKPPHARAARRGLPQRPRPSLPGGGCRSSPPRPPPARYLRRRQRRSRGCRRRRSSPAPLPCRASRRGAPSPGQGRSRPRRSPAMAARPRRGAGRPSQPAGGGGCGRPDAA